MKMFIHSSFGVLDCEPMKLQDLKDSVKEEELQADEIINSSVTADNQAETEVSETESASDSC